MAVVALGLSVTVGAVGLGAVPVGASTAPPSGDETPRTVNYAGLTWTVESVDIASSPGSDEPVLRLGLNVTSSLESTVVHVPAAILGVTLADGSLARASSFADTESPASIVVGPGASIDAVAIVEPGPGPVEESELSFVIDETDRTPAVLPLSGPTVASPYPIVEELTGTTDPMPGSCPTESTVEVALRRASVAVDLESRRAPLGTEFLTIDIGISAIDGFYDQACVSGPFFRLTVDGAVVEPVTGTTLNESIAVGATLESSVSFSVPTGARTFELGIGAAGETIASLPIVFADPVDATTTQPSP
jgi:hypothetical protein